jgi:hypothetical protein
MLKGDSEMTNEQTAVESRGPELVSSIRSKAFFSGRLGLTRAVSRYPGLKNMRRLPDDTCLGLTEVDGS